MTLHGTSSLFIVFDNDYATVYKYNLKTHKKRMTLHGTNKKRVKFISHIDIQNSFL